MEVGRGSRGETLLVALLRALDDELGMLDAEHAGTLGEGPGLLERFAEASSWVRGKRVRWKRVAAILASRWDWRPQDFFACGQGRWRVSSTVLSGGVREAEVES